MTGVYHHIQFLTFKSQYNLNSGALLQRLNRLLYQKIKLGLTVLGFLMTFFLFSPNSSRPVPSSPFSTLRPHTLPSSALPFQWSPDLTECTHTYPDLYTLLRALQARIHR